MNYLFLFLALKEYSVCSTRPASATWTLGYIAFCDGTLRFKMAPVFVCQGCQWEVIKNAELHFVVSLGLCSPKEAKTEAPKGLRERNMSCIVSEIISSDLAESQTLTFWN